eukprot:6181474-Pleurochrysis_carterae.AAC.1
MAKEVSFEACCNVCLPRQACSTTWLFPLRPEGVLPPDLPSAMSDCPLSLCTVCRASQLGPLDPEHREPRVGADRLSSSAGEPVHARPVCLGRGRCGQEPPPRRRACAPPWTADAARDLPHTRRRPRRGERAAAAKSQRDSKANAIARANATARLTRSPEPTRQQSKRE